MKASSRSDHPSILARILLRQQKPDSPGPHRSPSYTALRIRSSPETSRRSTNLLQHPQARLFKGDRPRGLDAFRHRIFLPHAPPG